MSAYQEWQENAASKTPACFVCTFYIRKKKTIQFRKSVLRYNIVCLISVHIPDKVTFIITTFFLTHFMLLPTHTHTHLEAL